MRTLRKIENHEEPYHRFDVEDGEPPFLTEWQHAEESLNILGKCCLCLVQNAFKNYLDGFIERSHAYGLLRKAAGASVKGRNWFDRSRTFFVQEYGIDWAKSPAVDVSLIEEVNFARNDIQHGGTFLDMEHRQNTEYFARFPASIFADELERDVFGGSEAEEPYRITVTKDSLFVAIQAIEHFCSYLDAEWQKHPV